jgi:hypothetical protein
MSKLKILGVAMAAGMMIAGCNKNESEEPTTVATVNGASLCSTELNGDVEKLLAARINVSRRVSTAYLKIIAVSRRKRILIKFLYVKATSAEIIVTAVLSVSRVPSVRKRNYLALASQNICRIFDKKPIIIYIYYVSHKNLL